MANAVGENIYQTSSHHDHLAERTRAYAVAAAAQLIEAAVSGSNANASLAVELTNLSKYADQIQEALKVK